MPLAGLHVPCLPWIQELVGAHSTAPGKPQQVPSTRISHRQCSLQQSAGPMCAKETAALNELHWGKHPAYGHDLWVSRHTLQRDEGQKGFTQLFTLNHASGDK